MQSIMFVQEGEPNHSSLKKLENKVSSTSYHLLCLETIPKCLRILGDFLIAIFGIVCNAKFPIIPEIKPLHLVHVFKFGSFYLFV